jgi:hypothetical protein
MNADRQPGNDGSLDAVLRSWTVKEPLPPRFEELVWQRIERAESVPDETVFSRLRALVEVVLPRPKVAVSYVTVLLALGLLGGAVAAQMKTARLRADLSTRYVHSIDPYQVQVLHR